MHSLAETGRQGSALLPEEDTDVVGGPPSSPCSQSTPAQSDVESKSKNLLASVTGAPHKIVRKLIMMSAQSRQHGLKPGAFSILASL